MNSIEGRIFITRHGETVSNAEHIIQGRQNIPLNERGKLQAQEKASQFSNYSIDYIATSPLDRTTETADIISKQLHINYTVYEALIARLYGSWQGKAIQWIKETYQELLTEMREWSLEEVFLKPPTPEIESYREVSERVLALFKEIIAIHPNQNGLFITHGGVITSLLLALQVSPKEIPLLKQDGYIELVYTQNQFRVAQIVGLCEHAPREDGKRVIVF